MSNSNESTLLATESTDTTLLTTASTIPDTTTQTPQNEPSTLKTNPNLKSKSMSGNNCGTMSSNKDNNNNRDTVFTLKKWNLVAMWSWDVECEVCAICRTPLMGKHFIMKSNLIIEI